MIKRKITLIFVVFMAFTSFVSNHAFSQGKIHLGPLRIYPALGERIEVDDNVFQVSGTERGTSTTSGLPIRDRESDIINIYTPALKLELPLRGGGFIPGKEHEFNLDWHSDFKNYKDHASENQQNHYFSANGIFRFSKGLEISLENDYEDTESQASSEVDQIHARKTYHGTITVNLPDYFRKFDAEIRYSYLDQEFDERALRRANRFDQNFTIKIPYKLTPKINIFPEYSYGFIEYDSPGGLTDQQSDSHYNEMYAGVEWYATAKTTGIIKLGFSSQDYDDQDTSDVGTFIAEIGVSADLTKRMNLNIKAGRGVAESEFTADSNSFERSFGDFSISRRVWKDLSVSFRGGYEKQVYHDSKRKEDIYKIGFSTKYNINKWMLADFRYSYNDRHSNFPSQADRVNLASIGIAFAF